jgi:hypothetical protein
MIDKSRGPGKDLRARKLKCQSIACKVLYILVAGFQLQESFDFLVNPLALYAGVLCVDQRLNRAANGNCGISHVHGSEHTTQSWPVQAVSLGQARV